MSTLLPDDHNQKLTDTNILANQDPQKQNQPARFRRSFSNVNRPKLRRLTQNFTAKLGSTPGFDRPVPIPIPPMCGQTWTVPQARGVNQHADEHHAALAGRLALLTCRAGAGAGAAHPPADGGMVVGVRSLEVPARARL
jgi:hypothetical protein